MPSLCAPIINNEKLLNRNTENSKLKHGAQTREHNVCRGREGIRYVQRERASDKSCAAGERESDVCSGREHLRCAAGDSIRGVQRERASEVCSGRWHLRCAAGEGIRVVQRKRTSEVCSGRGHQRCAEGEST
jgi:hypothetical protein